ncbi:hypothetical protein [Cellulosilyticum ruminicola]|uniref:hypothetical protein n=1 Tax=Cellulosilyticum ruminicola TaxID=425254 RepID=UPI0006D146BF|nr:hypothetical protein [Cellulosilyticum ruminicola]
MLGQNMNEASTTMQSIQDVYSYLYTAKQLEDKAKWEEAYQILKDINECKIFEYDKEAYGIYEDYVVEKVKFLEHLAALNLQITGDIKSSIRHIDEALILLDGIESVAPYIDIKEVKKLKKHYVQLLF